MIEAAKNRCKAPLRRPNVPTLWCTPSCLPTTTSGTATALAAREVVEWAVTVAAGRAEEVGREVAGPGPEAVVAGGIHRNLAPMARKFSSRFQRKQVAASMRFPRSRQWIKSTTA